MESVSPHTALSPTVQPQANLTENCERKLVQREDIVRKKEKALAERERRLIAREKALAEKERLFYKE